MIGCVRVPAFAAEVERRDRPDLRGRPLAVVQPDGGPERVYSATHEAARRGVGPGMTVSQARALCPEIRVLPPNRTHYRRVLADLTEALAHFSTQVEVEEGLELRADARRRKRPAYVQPSQLDGGQAATCYLDLGRLTRDQAFEMAGSMHQASLAQIGLPPAIGLASGKFPARVAATLLRPHEIMAVHAGQEARFLTPMPVSLLPVDGETLRQLEVLGLDTLGQVAALPPSAMLDRFGPQGRVMHRLANGRDTSPVLPYAPRRMERVTRQLDGPVRDRAILEANLAVIVERLVNRLQTEGLMARAVELTLHLDDGGVWEKDVILRQPTASPERIREVAGEMLRGAELACGVVEVELALSDLTPAVARQLSLFDREPVSRERLREALKDLVARYGDDCFYWAALTRPEARLPERRFRYSKAASS